MVSPFFRPPRGYSLIDPQRPSAWVFIRLRSIISEERDDASANLPAPRRRRRSRRSGSWPPPRASRSPRPEVRISGRADRRPTLDPAPAPGPLKNEIPPDALETVMASALPGPGLHGAVQVPGRRQGVPHGARAGPGLDPRLDQPGDRAAQRQRRQGGGGEETGGGAEPPPSNFDEALDLLAGVLDRDPDNPHAHFCRGIILEQHGRASPRPIGISSG